MLIFLQTQRLVLRQFTPADVDNLVDLDSDPDVMRFINGGRATPREVVETGILPAFLSYYERSPDYGFWAAIEKWSGQFLGWFQFRPADTSRRDEVELGYRLRKAAWGKGYATEGAAALIHRGFTTCTDVQRVVASTMFDHTASRRVMEKVGLELVRTVPHPWPEGTRGSGHARVEYALGRAQWEHGSSITRVQA
jgi:RimJ/RimL family protein N-acetyltransferase